MTLKIIALLLVIVNTVLTQDINLEETHPSSMNVTDGDIPVDTDIPTNIAMSPTHDVFPNKEPPLSPPVMEEQSDQPAPEVSVNPTRLPHLNPETSTHPHLVHQNITITPNAPATVEDKITPAVTPSPAPTGGKTEPPEAEKVTTGQHPAGTKKPDVKKPETTHAPKEKDSGAGFVKENYVLILFMFSGSVFRFLN